MKKFLFSVTKKVATTTYLLIVMSAMLVCGLAIKVAFCEDQSTRKYEMYKCFQVDKILHSQSAEMVKEHTEVMNNIKQAEYLLSFDTTLTDSEKEIVKEYIKEQILEGEKLCKDLKLMRKEKQLKELQPFKEKILK
jgi:hypothetical protein